jgi:hypothetical protein
LGFYLLPFHHSERKKHKLSPKFYFFDTGVLRAIQKRLSLLVTPETYEYGNYFETFFINEVIRINSYLKKDWQLSFLRTKNNVEVDLIIQTPLGQIIGIEIKSKSNPEYLDFKSGLAALKAFTSNVKFFCVCTGKKARLVEQIEILPFSEMLQLLRAL